MTDFVAKLASYLNLEHGVAPGIGPGLIEVHSNGIKFYIPKFVTRAKITRVDGYLGVARLNNMSRVDKIIDLSGSWRLNILNLIWMLPALYFDRDDVEAGARRFAPCLREAFDLLPPDPETFNPPEMMSAGDTWKTDRKAWLLGRLQRDTR